MSGNSVIPQRNSLVIPFEADLQVLAVGDVLSNISNSPSHKLPKLFVVRVDGNKDGTETKRKWQLTVKSSFKSASDSSSFNPSILFVNPGFTNSAFSPVAGWTLTMGCFEITGARRTLPKNLKVSRYSIM
jgi:hypothetical protein